MACVWVPALLRPLAGGAESVETSGATLRDVIDDLDRQHPGFRDRLTENGAIRSEIILTIAGVEAPSLGAPVPHDAEVHIVPAIAGGA
jgi:molybdopterin converting factor small subunit